MPGAAPCPTEPVPAGSERAPLLAKVCWVCAVREGLQGWLLREATRSFPGSNPDPPQAKAEPISNGGCASGVAYLRRGKKPNSWVV